MSDIHPELDAIAPSPPPEEGLFDQQLSLPLYIEATPEPFSTILKRDGREELFERRKVSAAILKAAGEDSGIDAALANDLAAAVTIYLSKRLGSQPPNADQVSDAVERVLIQMAHARTALSYARYRDRRGRIRRLRAGDWRALLAELEEAQQARSALGGEGHAALFVRSSREQLVDWDRARIVTALARETGLERGPAELVAAEVEDQIRRAGLQTLTSSLVRELVSAKLIEHGLEAYRHRHMRLGVPLYDTERILTGITAEGPAIDPAATDRVLARAVKKEYALSQVFDVEVAEAHLRGTLHLHHLDRIDRIHRLEEPLDSVARSGLGTLGRQDFARPPRYASTLLAQLVKRGQQLQPLCTGPVTWPAFNVYFAPYLRDFSAAELRQFAQMVIYEFAFQALGSGAGQDPPEITLCWTAPPQLAELEAVGPGGQPTGRTYGGEMHAAQQFAWALLDVLREGNAGGIRFAAPSVALLVDADFFRAPGHERILQHAAALPSYGGAMRFVLRRTPEAAAQAAPVLGQVSLNLPRLAYESGSVEALLERADPLLGLAVAAQEQRRRFLATLYARAGEGPLAQLAAPGAGRPPLELDRGHWWIGVAGLHEAAAYLTKAPRSGHEESVAMARRIAEHLAARCRSLGVPAGLHLALAQPEGPEVGWRFATLDAQQFPQSTVGSVSTHPTTQALFYSVGAALPPGHGLSPAEQARLEGTLHAAFDERAETTVVLPDSEMAPETLAEFVRKVYHQTGNCCVRLQPEH